LIVGFHESADDEGCVVLALLPPEEESLAAWEPPPHATAIDVNEASMAERSHRVFGFFGFMRRIVRGCRGPS
jgi:hypothetical protein